MGPNCTRRSHANAKRPSHGVIATSFRRVLVVLALVGGLGLASGTSASAQDSAISREDPIKAAFLYNFAKYTTLSDAYIRTIDNATEAITIGILGNSSVEAYLRKIASRKTVKGKPLVIVRFDTAEAIAPCHLLFIPSMLSDEVRSQVAETLQGTGAFIVTETQGELFRQTSFYLEENHVRFEINLSAIEAANIQVDSRLLALGRVVRSGDHP